jgi:hypothetical protein
MISSLVDLLVILTPMMNESPKSSIDLSKLSTHLPNSFNLQLQIVYHLSSWKWAKK